MPTHQYDIAIVGYGPVGALAALLLAEEGLRVAVLEQSTSTEPLELPRAVGLDGESVRTFQRIGLGDEVEAILQPPRETDEVCFTNSKRERLFGTEMHGVANHGWRDNAFFDQPELESVLRGWVSAHEGIEVHFGCEVSQIETIEDGVALKTESGATFRSTYAIGCDGASSFVRDTLGIEWTSLGYDQDWLVIDIVQEPTAELPLVTMQVCDPARLTTYVCVKDPNRRWEFQLLPGETREHMLQDETIAQLLDSWLPRDHYSIRRSAVYQFHAATAEQWKRGRVFLAGDSAHQTPPFLGQGLNAGFRDAVNLAWKLPRVLAGTCGEALLDSYFDERDAHARDLVDWAVAIGKLMETLAAREAGLPDPHPVDASSGYGQGRTAPPLRGGALIPDQEVGVLLRQPQIRLDSGEICRFDELLGRDFAVIGRTAADVELGYEARRILDRLGGRCVVLEDFETIEGEHDSLFAEHPALIVRPDRYVFGLVDADWSLDQLLTELAARVALR